MLVTLVAGIAVALDPPHDDSWGIECSSCHTPHDAPGGAITTVGGNANLCLSCHMVGGLATNFPFADSDQAFPGPGLPAGTEPSGTSHRWDSGAAGHVEPDPTNSSTGAVESGGLYGGDFATAYTIDITAAGDAGAAVFSWSNTLGDAAVGMTSGTDISLGQGLTVTFVDGSASPSFAAGDRWQLFVRTDLRSPVTTAMALRTADGTIMCSTCHDQHSQSEVPFDPAAPVYGGSGTGEGRHFQRSGNAANEMCVDCHQPRDVTEAAQGSHPVGVVVPGTGHYQTPGTLPLDPGSEVVCMTCHVPHAAAATDGSLLRSADTVALCADCHTLADTTTPARHQDATSSATLWPGGQYGSSFPAVTDPAKQGSCGNCHRAHGWPVTTDTANDYPWLLVDVEENQCDTCHDGDPASVDVRGEFGKTFAHPLTLADGVHDPAEAAVVTVRHVECTDCHNPHRALGRVDLPGPSTSPRPASGPLTGVRGVDASGVEVDPASYEYEVCLRCHGDSPDLPTAPTSRQFPESNLRFEFDGGFTSFHAVAVAGTPTLRVPSLIGGWTTSSILACTGCHNNDTGAAAGDTGPNGPHGSGLPTLLERQYETADGSTYSPARYAMCFKCHAFNVVMSGGTSFQFHPKHVSGERIPCNVCHDPHASSGQRYLINFDTDVVADAGGTLSFIAPEDSGDGNGYCYVSCHEELHNPASYTPN
jgi:predicted CXXCH cytochrome family protein